MDSKTDSQADSPRAVESASASARENANENASDDFRSTVRAVLNIQLATTLIATAAVGWFAGWSYALAALYGGACAIVVMAWLAWRMAKLRARLRDNETISMSMIVAGAAPRLLFLLVAFGVGIGLLKLHALTLMVVFALGYLAYVLSFRRGAHT